jgi:hypothetical protein
MIKLSISFIRVLNNSIICTFGQMVLEGAIYEMLHFEVHTLYWVFKK